MARPRYPSDDARQRIKPHVRIHHSITNHPRFAAIVADSDLFAMLVRLWLVASQKGAAHTGDQLTLSRADVAWITARLRRDMALTSLSRLAHVAAYSLRHDGDITVIHVRNFAKKQNITPRLRRVATRNSAASPLRTPHSALHTELVSPDEKTQEILTPVHEASSKPKTEDEKLKPEDLVEGWNECASMTGLAQVRQCRGSRRKRTLDRLREQPDVGFWTLVFRQLKTSRFLRGQAGGNGNGHAPWRADFDWLVSNDVNCVKVSEGKYE